MSVLEFVSEHFGLLDFFKENGMPSTDLLHVIQPSTLNYAVKLTCFDIGLIL